MKKYYKIVSNFAGRFESWDVPPTKYSVTYELGKETKAKIGGLLVFEELNDVRQFIRFGGMKDSALLYGTGGPLVDLPSYRVAYVLSEERVERMRLLWEGKGFRSRTGFDLVREPWPQGTLAIEWYRPEVLFYDWTDEKNKRRLQELDV